ncbi:hypothetical protein BP5796_03436 [Coleophoma crateriformis]|uniref:Major facilitator superfamily (MFS) profile domain-containing protein n=1 Tax=Coleophoma crateriformis TaxID=565419 RepID=A0A3D8SN74_9HELO|nr:hypothetical protein BP5796_03436 [Coleophoma crateriformis]
MVATTTPEAITSDTRTSTPSTLEYAAEDHERDPSVLEAGRPPGYTENEKVTEKPEDVRIPSSGSRHEQGPGNETMGYDEFEVWWEKPEDQDPENPMNWPDRRKWMNILAMSGITFLVPLASSMFAPAIPEVLLAFKTTSTTFATFVVSIFVLGFAFGPLILAPLSEIYGRVIVYNVTNVLFLVFTIMCALAQDTGMLLACRFLAGFAGVATITCGSGTIADIMPRERRGGAMALWSLGPILGPMIGPIVGGYLTAAAGWRWVFWLIAITFGIVTIFAFLVMRETYAPVILGRKAARLRKSTGNPAYHSRLSSDLTTKQLFAHSIMRPVKMFCFSPIVAAMCIYIAVMYGLLYILFTTFTFVFEGVYGFSTSSAGLAFIGSGIGTFCGLAFVAGFSDRTLKRRAAKGKTITPEDRLPFLITVPAALSLPIGLFMYGWGVEYRVHWILAQIGTTFIGFGMIAILMCIQTYLVDAYTLHAASVTAANAVLRSLLGALLPLGGLKLYDSLGYGWGNSLLAFIALALAPTPWLFGMFGERIRTNPKFQVSF